jgi:hypothetical protein
MLLSHILTQFPGSYSWIFLTFFASLVGTTVSFYIRPHESLENQLFWLAGALLVSFTAFHPLGLGRDDLAYIEISKKICPIAECLTFIDLGRDWAWYFMVGLLKIFVPSERAPLVLSAMSLLIKLYVIGKLCKHKLLALTLFIPLTYLFFDFTLLRAGVALTFFFTGLYFLINSQKVLGAINLLSNYLFHSQGIFSIAVIPFGFIAKNRYISIATITFLLACIYLQWLPPTNLMRFLTLTDSMPYRNQYQEGLFANEPLLPIAQLLVIAYCVFLLLVDKKALTIDLVEQYVLASILLGTFLAWFFAPIHLIQTRLFDFYIAPLVFLVGNLKLSKLNLSVTLGLASLLYARMELIHNWILG